jgi:hypothetical protein
MRMAGCGKNNPPAQSRMPSEIETPKKGTTSTFVRGAIKEIWENVSAMMGHVAICAARVTAIISAT